MKLTSNDIWEIKKDMVGFDVLSAADVIKIATKFKLRPKIIRSIFNGDYMGHVLFPRKSELHLTYQHALATRGNPYNQILKVKHDPGLIKREAIINNYLKTTIRFNS